MQLALDPSIWPRDDYSRVPYALYHDAGVYALEQERVFRGPVWSYLGLAAEIPRPGDFRTTSIGDIPILYNRAGDGSIHAFVNRCAHRGAVVRRETCGNAKTHICIYHSWSYSLQGDLVGIPFRKGIKGVGGMAADFDEKTNGLRKLRVAAVGDALFATFSPDAPPLEAYLGETPLQFLKGLFRKPVRILGYQRQFIRANWKMYLENARDPYHASLLHQFLVAFGIDRAATQRGGVAMDPRHRHSVTYAYAGSDSDKEASSVYAAQQLHSGKLQLAAPEFIRFRAEVPDALSLSLTSVFPNAVLIQVNNSLATRQVRPKGVDGFELFQTLFAYEDDDADMVDHRLLQANLVGPAGYISMEDAEAIEICHRATRFERDAAAVLEMGGRGPIVDQPTRLTDVPVRGFWSYYSDLMGIAPQGACR